jgi:hypothetical protein
MQLVPTIMGASPVSATLDFQETEHHAVILMSVLQDRATALWIVTAQTPLVAMNAHVSVDTTMKAWDMFVQILMNVWMLHVTLMPHATTRWGVTPVNVGMGFLGMDLIALIPMSVRLALMHVTVMLPATILREAMNVYVTVASMEMDYRVKMLMSVPLGEKNSGYTCDENADCYDTAGSYECTCFSGYTGDGYRCQDIHECLLACFLLLLSDAHPALGLSHCLTHPCDENATCTNNNGSFSCQCNTGFSGNGTSCRDIDECFARQSNCSVNSNCTNTFGSYECSCFSGYYDEGMGYVCTGMFVDLSFLHDLFIIDIQILMNVW